MIEARTQVLVPFMSEAAGRVVVDNIAYREKAALIDVERDDGGGEAV